MWRKSRSLIVVVGFLLAFTAAAIAADINLVRPLGGATDVVVLYLPQAGQTCELLLPIERLYQWPATTLDIPTVTQGQPMAKVGDRLDPIPPPEGSFDVKACKEELVWGGRGIRLTFVVPDKMTTISLIAHSPIWNNIHALRGGVYYGAKDRFSPISVEIYPMQPWTEFIGAVSSMMEAEK